jgi:hypothetical protein
MADELTKIKDGRPTIRSEAIVTKLESVLKIGSSDTAACSYAGISRETFYRWIKEDEDFCDRIENARNYAILAARHVVVTSIIEDKNLDTSKWYIEKHDAKQQGNQQNTQVNVFTTLKDKYMIDDEVKTEVKTETITNGVVHDEKTKLQGNH